MIVDRGVSTIEIHAKTILRKQKRVESWFLSRYSMNLYRGCVHNCIYCDGRAEKYRVDGEFGRDVTVKVNAPDVLARELDSTRRRKPLPRGLVFLGGGVSDSYQPLEREYRITRSVLTLLRDRGWSVHILTKSILVERDIDLLTVIDRQSRAIVSFSFSTVDDEIARIVEPGVPPPSRRLDAIRRFSDAGLPCGVYLLPVLPHITDAPGLIEEAFTAFRSAGARFVVSGGLTLKEGRQKEYFLDRIGTHRPELVAPLQRLYPSEVHRPYGEAVVDQDTASAPRLLQASDRSMLPLRPPISLVSHCMSERDRVVVVLEHLAYLLRLRGVRSPFGYAAHQIASTTVGGDPSSLPRNLSTLVSIPGIGEATARLIVELLETGTSRRYDELLRPWRR